MANPFLPANLGNLQGTLAGVLAGAATAYIAKLGYLSSVAAFFSLPVEDITYAAVVLFAGLANYGITHFSQLKALSDLYESLPTTYAEYPKDKKKSEESSNGNYNK